MHIVHISDLHFGLPMQCDPAELRSAIQSLHPELLVVSGDLTHRARKREYVTCAAFLSELGIPCLTVPGNHDISIHHPLERLLRPWKKWHAYISPGSISQYRGMDCTVFGVNTVRRLGWYWDWSRGRISREQVGDLQQSLASEPEKAVTVLVAHHPFRLPEKYRKRSLIMGGNYALPRLAAGGVDLILGGHVHVPFTTVCKGIIISHAGTPCVKRVPGVGANSFNSIRTVGEDLVITCWILQGKRYSREQEQRFRKRDTAWSVINT